MENIFIAGPVGQLEACVHGDSIEAPAHIAVICHPHPLHGGTMSNKVVSTLVRACRDAVIPAVRFNFRGVGASEGQHDNARGECDDARAVIAYARLRWPNTPLILAGFSFGSYVAYAIANEVKPQLLISVAPPAPKYPFDNHGMPACPWLVLMGDEDEVIAASDVYAWFAALPDTEQPRDLVRFPGAGHFFHGKLIALKEALLPFLKQSC